MMDPVHTNVGHETLRAVSFAESGGPIESPRRNDLKCDVFHIMCSRMDLDAQGPKEMYKVFKLIVFLLSCNRFAPTCGQ